MRSMVAFNYRRVPAIALARKLVQDGRLGTVRHVRAQYLQDWIVDPSFPLVWRLQKDRAGSGALGDIGAHIIDLAQHVVGAADHRRHRSHRDLRHGSARCPEASSGLAASGGSGTGEVTVDDAALFLARFDSGAHRLVRGHPVRQSGRKNAMRLEINGSEGSLAFDFESMNELQFHDHTEDAETAGFRRILVTEPTHPYLAGLVAARSRAGLRAHVHPRGGRPGPGHRHGTATVPVVRRRAPGAAGAGGRRALGGARQRLGETSATRGAREPAGLSVAQQPA